MSQGKLKLTPQTIAEKSSKSVVQITSKNSSGEILGFGTGFFAGPNQVVTNFHVIDGASFVTVNALNSGRVYEVTKVNGYSIENDLAILLIDGVEKPLSITEVLPKIGDTVYVNGNPKGLTGTFSSGIVSAIRGESDNTRIQITAPISPGSSGSPVMNAKGEVIGVASSAVLNGQNLNFVIPFIVGIHMTQIPLTELPTSRLRPAPIRVSSPVYARDFKYNGQGSPISFSIVNNTYDRIMMSGYSVVWYDKRMNRLSSEFMSWIQTIEPGATWEWGRFPRSKAETLKGQAYFAIEDILYKAIK
jgi:hypothetical protein